MWISMDSLRIRPPGGIRDSFPIRSASIRGNLPLFLFCFLFLVLDHIINLSDVIVSVSISISISIPTHTCTITDNGCQPAPCFVTLLARAYLPCRNCHLDNLSSVCRESTTRNIPRTVILRLMNPFKISGPVQRGSALHPQPRGSERKSPERATLVRRKLYSPWPSEVGCCASSIM